MDKKKEQALESAKQMVVEVRNFNVESIFRRDGELGRFGFGHVVDEANHLVSLFQQLPLAILSQLPPRRLRAIAGIAETSIRYFNEAINFKVAKMKAPKDLKSAGNLYLVDNVQLPLRQGKEGGIGQLGKGLFLTYIQIDEAKRDFPNHDVEKGIWQAILDGKAESSDNVINHQNIVSGILRTYHEVHDTLLPQISYGILAGTDMATLERSIRDKVAEAGRLLAQVHDTAAEQGVFLQATHFKKEAFNHFIFSILWGIAVMAMGGMLGVYPFYIDKLFPVDLAALSELSDTAERFVFLTGMLSRMLVFFVLSFGLFFCVKNYMAHRHNAVVNRHRQKALETYRALVDGTSIPENADIVLAHAARCIYAPQNTGFARADKSENQMGTTEIIRHSSEGIRVARAVKGE